MTKRFGICAFLAAVLALVTVSHVFATGAIAKEAAKTPAPGFTLKGLKDQPVSLSDLNGKGGILFFFTTWCPYCREKFPMLKQKEPALAAEGVRLLIVDVGESREKVAAFAEKQQVPFDILLDRDGSVAAKYGVVGVPTFIVIDKEQQIVYSGNEMPDKYKDLLSA